MRGVPQRSMTILQRLFRQWRGRSEPSGSPAPDLRATAALVMAAEARHRETARHGNRVQTLTTLMGRAIGLRGPELKILSTAALLHDIGKLAIPEQILTKPGKLSVTELEIVRTHSIEGAEMLKRIGFDPELSQIVRSHHERMDGSGYPDGLRGAAIPLGARLVAVADCFDALCSQRQYRKALSPEDALELMRRDCGVSFDPLAIDMLGEAVRHLYHLPKQGYRYGESVVRPAENGADRQQWLRRVSAAVPYDAVAVWEDKNGKMRCAVAAGQHANDLRNLSMRVGDGISGWVASSGKDLISGNPALEGNAQIFLQFRSVLAIPVEPGSVLAVYSTEPDAYGPEHATALRDACSRASY